MNIFYIDHDVYKCAEAHNDKHVVKMILESCQLLSTAHRVLDGTETIELSKTGRKVKRWKLPDSNLDNILYGATHVNHPSAVWCRQTNENYIWLCNLAISLCGEYTHRYDKFHKVERDGLLNTLYLNRPKNVPVGPFTPPTPAMDDKYKVKDDSLLSYRKYYIEGKNHLAKWTKRNPPYWYIIKNDIHV